MSSALPLFPSSSSSLSLVDAAGGQEALEQQQKIYQQFTQLDYSYREGERLLVEAEAEDGVWRFRLAEARRRVCELAADERKRKEEKQAIQEQLKSIEEKIETQAALLTAEESRVFSARTAAVAHRAASAAALQENQRIIEKMREYKQQIQYLVKENEELSRDLPEKLEFLSSSLAAARAADEAIEKEKIEENKTIEDLINKRETMRSLKQRAEKAIADTAAAKSRLLLLDSEYSLSEAALAKAKQENKEKIKKIQHMQKELGRSNEEPEKTVAFIQGRLKRADADRLLVSGLECELAEERRKMLELYKRKEQIESEEENIEKESREIREQQERESAAECEESSLLSSRERAVAAAEEILKRSKQTVEEEEAQHKQTVERSALLRWLIGQARELLSLPLFEEWKFDADGYAQDDANEQAKTHANTETVAEEAEKTMEELRRRIDELSVAPVLDPQSESHWSRVSAHGGPRLHERAQRLHTLVSELEDECESGGYMQREEKKMEELREEDRLRNEADSQTLPAGRLINDLFTAAIKRERKIIEQAEEKIIREEEEQKQKEKESGQSSGDRVSSSAPRVTRSLVADGQRLREAAGERLAELSEREKFTDEWEAMAKEHADRMDTAAQRMQNEGFHWTVDAVERAFDSEREAAAIMANAMREKMEEEEEKNRKEAEQQKEREEKHAREEAERRALAHKEAVRQRNQAIRLKRSLLAPAAAQGEGKVMIDLTSGESPAAPQAHLRPFNPPLPRPLIRHLPRASAAGGTSNLGFLLAFRKEANKVKKEIEIIEDDTAPQKKEQPAPQSRPPVQSLRSNRRPASQAQQRAPAANEVKENTTSEKMTAEKKQRR